MIKPHEMVSILITGPKKMQGQIIEELHSMKVIHLVDHSKNELVDIGMPLETAQRYSESLVRARALISALGIKKEESGRHIVKIEEIEKSVSKTGDELSEINKDLSKIEEAKAKNDLLSQELEILKNIDIPLESISEMKSLACFTGFAKDDDSLEKIKNELSKLNFAMAKSVTNGKIFAVIFVDAKSKENASEVLQKNGFLHSALNCAKGLKGTALSNLKKISQENAKLEASRQGISKRLEKLKFEKKDSLSAIENYLAERLEIAEAPLRFANTKSSFLIKGWVPSCELSKSAERLEKAGNNKIHIHSESPKKNDKVPVKLNNIKAAKPFEFFIDLYSYPLHKEIDPTFFIFLTFPIFFGAMLGDVGYGLFSLVLFLVLKKLMPKAKGFFNILIVSSLVSILFGFVFGEFFGIEFLHPLVKRSADNSMFMPLALIIGAIHVNIGLIVGFFNEKKSHGVMHAIYAKISFFVLEIGALIIGLRMASIFSIYIGGADSINLPLLGIISWSVIVGIFVIVISLIMLSIGEGIKGPIESLSIFTNILSYARLMAIGLSSVILAEIINESSKEMFHSGGIMILVGVLVLVLGHGINLLLGLLGGFLHSLRLHYVEFFSKFFQGGGNRYLPFGLKE